MIRLCHRPPRTDSCHIVELKYIVGRKKPAGPYLSQCSLQLGQDEVSGQSRTVFFFPPFLFNSFKMDTILIDQGIILY